jgi:hypothetical protein
LSEVLLTNELLVALAVNLRCIFLLPCALGSLGSVPFSRQTFGSSRRGVLCPAGGIGSYRLRMSHPSWIPKNLV